MLSLVLSRVDLEASGVWEGVSSGCSEGAWTTYELLLGLGVEVLASGLRHVDVCGSGCWVRLIWFGLVGFECRLMQ
jgi:hypothetical protein